MMSLSGHSRPLDEIFALVAPSKFEMRPRPISTFARRASMLRVSASICPKLSVVQCV